MGVISTGVRQGCSLSPLSCVIYDEALMKEATENMQEGISVGGATVSLIRYADDNAVMARLEYLVDSINKVSKAYNMKINTKSRM